MNSTFCARWLTSSEVISQVLFTSEQPKKNKMAFVGILSLIKLFFGALVIQLVWCILKQIFTSVSVKVVDIYLAASLLGMTNFELSPVFWIPVRKAPISKASDIDLRWIILEGNSFFSSWVVISKLCFCLIQQSIILECPLVTLQTYQFSKLIS